MNRALQAGYIADALADRANLESAEGIPLESFLADLDARTLASTPRVFRALDESGYLETPWSRARNRYLLARLDTYSSRVQEILIRAIRSGIRKSREFQGSQLALPI